jgi:hypothetical protein
MSLLDGENFVHENHLPFNLVKCSKRMPDVEPVNDDILPEIEEFFIPAFSRVWIRFESTEMGLD